MEILNIELEEKTDFSIKVTFRDDTTNLPINLTGYSAIMQLRDTFGGNIVYLELTSPNGGITLGGQSGLIEITFEPADTTQIEYLWNWTRAAYDLILIDPDGKRKKILKGFVTVGRSATI
jgi:hypothetical protein